MTGAADEFAELVRLGEQRAAAQGELHVPAGQFYLEVTDLEQQLQSRPRLDFSSLQVYQLEADHPVYRVNVQGNTDLRSAVQHDGRLADLTGRLRDWLAEEWRILLVCHQRGQAERLLDLLAPSGLPYAWTPELIPGRSVPPGVTVTVGPVNHGFRLMEERLVVLTDDEIFGPRTHRRVKRERRVFESSLADLKESDLVVR